MVSTVPPDSWHHRFPTAAGTCRSSPNAPPGLVAQHLLVLADAGLVEAEKVGRQRVYRVLPSGLRKLQAEIDRTWTEELDQLITDAHTLRSPR